MSSAIAAADYTFVDAPIDARGVQVNESVPVAHVPPWKRQAFKKITAFTALPHNWDGNGSDAPSWAARQMAFDLLIMLPGDLPVPAVVPVSGGGLQFEWTNGQREVEVFIDGEGQIETLRVQEGMPVEDDAATEVGSLFAWLMTQ